MTFLLLTLGIVTIILYYFILYNDKLSMENKKIRDNLQSLKNKMIQMEFEINDKNNLLQNIQQESLQLYAYAIKINQTLKTQTHVAQNKIATLQSELYNARQRTKRLAKKIPSAL